MKLLLIRQVWKHHASKSGYDRVFQTFDGNDVQSIMVKQLKGYGWLQKVLGWLSPKQKNHISASLFVTELRIVFKCLFFRPDVIHFTYLQKEFILLKYNFFRPKAKLIATIHLPCSFWKEEKQTWTNFDYLDKIIVLDAVSYSFFEQDPKTKTKVELVSHPVDMTYFYPDSSMKFDDEKIHCLYIGRFLRDLDLFFDIVECCYENHPDIIFHFSYPATPEWIEDATRLKQIIALSNVKYQSYISEEKLKELYQSCHVLIQPLNDSTANNVILEAVASGLPVVVNDLPALHDYLNNETAVFCKKDKEEFIKGIYQANKMELNPKNNKIKNLNKIKAQLKDIYFQLITSQLE
jgi:glycosyltransferase involved in cell wall biosynthesis